MAINWLGEILVYEDGKIFTIEWLRIEINEKSIQGLPWSINKAKMLEISTKALNYMNTIMAQWQVNKEQELTYDIPIWKQLINEVVRLFYWSRSHLMSKSVLI